MEDTIVASLSDPHKDVFHDFKKQVFDKELTDKEKSWCGKCTSTLISYV